MKTILLGVSVFLSTLISAQNYPDYYPVNNNNNYSNNSDYYGNDEDAYYFPDDYYYEYPSDYYTGEFYQSSYNDYRNSINDVNWNRFFSRYRLSPWQIQQIVMLNNSYASYSSWNSIYRYNPDRWYYDRFYALENILGPRIFVSFQNNYYNGYNPVAYYQNYRRQHYVTNVYVVPRYRNINVNRYRIDRKQYSQANPRQNFGFQNDGRNGNGNWNNATNGNGFRDDIKTSNGSGNNGFRKEVETPKANSLKTNNSNGFRNNTDASAQKVQRNESSSIRANSSQKIENNVPKSNSGFRNSNPGIRNTTPERRIDNSSQKQNIQKSGTVNTGRSGMRFTGQ